MKNYAEYHISLKLLLRRGDEYLFLRCSKSDHRPHLDLPGGRIDDNEDSQPIKEILSREISEELGPDIRYRIGTLQFQYRRFFPEYGFKVFLPVYSGEYLGGVIKLSSEHNESIWINPKTSPLKQEDFLGTEEFEAFRNHFHEVF